METTQSNRDLYRVCLELLRENYSMAEEYHNMVENYSRMCDNYWRFIQRQENISNRFFERFMGSSNEISREPSTPNYTESSASNLGNIFRTPLPVRSVRPTRTQIQTQNIYSLTPAFSRSRGLPNIQVRNQQREDYNTNILELFRNIFDVSRETDDSVETDVRPSRQYSVTDISNTTYNAGLIRDTMCPIGLEDFIEGEPISIICGCGHAFKKENLERWLVRNSVCPVCRYDIVRRQPADSNMARGEEDGVSQRTTQGIVEFVFNMDASGNISRETTFTDNSDLDVLRNPTIQRALSNLVLEEFLDMYSTYGNGNRNRNGNGRNTANRNQERDRNTINRNARTAQYDTEVIVDSDSEDEIGRNNLHVD